MHRLSENKAMKLLTTSFFTLLLGFAGSSYGQSFEETKLLAEQGYVNAQYNLGVMYSNGEGVPQNDIRAYVWYSVAATQGGEDARGNRDIVSERLSPAGREQAQQIATKCFESDYQDCK